MQDGEHGGTTVDRRAIAVLGHRINEQVVAELTKIEPTATNVTYMGNPDEVVWYDMSAVTLTTQHGVEQARIAAEKAAKMEKDRTRREEERRLWKLNQGRGKKQW